MPLTHSLARCLDGCTLLMPEPQAPFRLPRIILFGTLFASSTLGLFIIISRLIKSLQGKVLPAELGMTRTDGMRCNWQ